MMVHPCFPKIRVFYQIKNIWTIVENLLMSTRISRIRRNQNLDNHKECSALLLQIQELSEKLFDKVQSMTPRHYESYAKSFKLNTTTRELKNALDNDIHKLEDSQLPEGTDRDTLKFIYYPLSSSN